ncbi:MAG: phosphate signaling complex protein PhoU [Pseudomonadota bacterium]
MGAFDADLHSLRARVSEMGGLAEELLSDALQALHRRDAALAERVVEGDRELDMREVALEEMAVRTLALRQPLAQDLRETIAALKIASTLERIGDLSKNIARRVPTLPRLPNDEIEDGILRLGEMARGQLADVLDAYGMSDTRAAETVWRRDIDIDVLHNDLLRRVISVMSQNNALVGHGAQLLFMTKNLERIGDHTTFIAEMTYYVVIGRPLGDDRPKGDPLFPLPDSGET